MAIHSEKVAYYPHTLPDHHTNLIDQAKNPLIPREPYGGKVVAMQRVAERVEPRRRYGVVYERQHTSKEQEGGHLERLISVQEVIDTLDVPESTVRHWVATGRLKERGRVWLARPGGRGTPLVSQAEAEFLINNRPPMGRPRKRSK
jgi:hypothetical protein